MEDIKKILICPECRCELSDALVCNGCGNIYSYKYGVFDIISEKLSDLSKLARINWKNCDKAFANKTTAENIEFTANFDFNSYKNKETKEAEHKLITCMEGLIEDFSGVVCDLATGMGGMLQKLIDSPNKNFNIICTDIDKAVLTWTRKIKKTDDNRIFYMASDGRYMSIKDQTIDYITSVAAFGNIPESEQVAKELYRILKPGGQLIICGKLVERGSKSYKSAMGYGPELRTADEFLAALNKGGFENAVAVVVAAAVCAENPYDLMHAAGDKMLYCVIIAQRT
ncbi:MAG: class I SAM-dependent methyltransferase [Eubacteriales bacterium]